MEEQNSAPEQLKDYCFKPGESGNPSGRPPMSANEKLVKKAAKQIIAEYKEALAEALPLIQPVLIAKAVEGDISAIKEVHDRAMDKAKQPTDITSGGERLSISFDNSFNVKTAHQATGDNQIASQI
jgi:hypothetical protein